ncbi:hypothetical protein L7F22_037008 [Adiantum nelumboides]|nr:hypothetical protein [Adiantum nelumboides]
MYLQNKPLAFTCRGSSPNALVGCPQLSKATHPLQSMLQHAAALFPVHPLALFSWRAGNSLWLSKGSAFFSLSLIGSPQAYDSRDLALVFNLAAPGNSSMTRPDHCYSTPVCFTSCSEPVFFFASSALAALPYMKLSRLFSWLPTLPDQLPMVPLAIPWIHTAVHSPSSASHGSGGSCSCPSALPLHEISSP